METPALVCLLYCMFTIPTTQGIQKLPAANWLMAALFVGSAIYDTVDDDWLKCLAVVNPLPLPGYHLAPFFEPFHVSNPSVDPALRPVIPGHQ